MGIFTKRTQGMCKFMIAREASFCSRSEFYWWVYWIVAYGSSWSHQQKLDRPAAEAAAAAAVGESNDVSLRWRKVTQDHPGWSEMLQLQQQKLRCGRSPLLLRRQIIATPGNLVTLNQLTAHPGKDSCYYYCCWCVCSSFYCCSCICCCCCYFRTSAVEHSMQEWCKRHRIITKTWNQV